MIKKIILLIFLLHSVFIIININANEKNNFYDKNLYNETNTYNFDNYNDYIYNLEEKNNLTLEKIKIF